MMLRASGIIVFSFCGMAVSGCAGGEEVAGTTDHKAPKIYEGASEDLRLFRGESSLAERYGGSEEEWAALSKEELKQIEQMEAQEQAFGMKMAGERAFMAAERLFDKYPFKGLTKDEVLKLLGPPSPETLFKEEWWHEPCPAPKNGEELLNYVLVAPGLIFGPSPRVYTLCLREGVVVEVQAPPKIPKSIGVVSWGMADEVATLVSPGKKHKIRVMVLDGGATHSGNFWTLVLLSTPDGEFVIAQGLSGYDVRYGKVPFPLEWDGEDAFSVSFVNDLHNDSLTRYKVDIQTNLKKAIDAGEGEKVNVYCPVTFR